MSRHDSGAVAAAGFGLGFLLLGCALLLQELDMLTLRWSFVLPLIVVTVGVVVLVSGLTGAHRAHRSSPVDAAGLPLDAGRWTGTEPPVTPSAAQPSTVDAGTDFLRPSTK